MGHHAACFSPWKKRVVLGVAAANNVLTSLCPDAVVSSLSCSSLGSGFWDSMAQSYSEGPWALGGVRL